MLSGDLLAQYQRVVVELGMGDGRLLEALARTAGDSLFTGIEIDPAQCDAARSRMIQLKNVRILDGSFEQLIDEFPDESVDQFIAVLPDPAYIDEKKQKAWMHLYRRACGKLKPGGRLQLVTELTDELLQPVSDEACARWKTWLAETFTLIGFSLEGTVDGAPANYSTRCLDQFRRDPERIRIVTMNLVKPYLEAAALREKQISA